jgi:anti-anti-sigma regulatory factor
MAQADSAVRNGRLDLSGISIHETWVGDVVILAPDGGAGLGEKLGLRDRVAELIGRGTKRFVVNLERTWGWGSLLIGELVSVSLLCQRSAASLKLLNPPRRLGAVLAIAKLDSVFEIYETEEAAIDSPGRPGRAHMAA